jgi:hypothetical protein
MGLEVGNTIEQLNRSWPLPSDVVSQGDDHLVLIKTVLKATFPGAGGQGFNTPIIATEQELNYLTGLRGNVQDQLDLIGGGVVENLFAPRGTVMLFINAAPPNGWTQRTNSDGYMLRIVADGTGGTKAGDKDGFNIPLEHAHTTTGHVLELDELPAGMDQNMILSLAGSTQSDNHSDAGSVARGSASSSAVSSTPIGFFTPGGQPHSHGNTGTTLQAWTPKYMNTIQAVKE